MKVITLIETISDFLASDLAGDAKGQYHPAIIRQHLSDVFNQAIFQTYMEGKKRNDYSQLDAWSRLYPCAVVDQVGAKAHVFLPFAPISLPEGLGIQAVYNHDDSNMLLAPIESDAQVIFRELEVDTMDSVPVYTLEQNSLATGAGEPSHMIRLDKLPVAPATLITFVDVMMLVGIEALDEYDDLSCPMGMEDTLVRQVLDIMSKKPKSDTSNDMVNQNPVQ